MRVGSLFAGIGGFDLAAERAGMEVAWQSEIDRKASAVLKHHWPKVPNYGDIHYIDRMEIPDDGTELRGSVPPAVDVLTGGFPCQDYSVAGNRGGLAGDRGALWWEYLRVIDSIRPTWVVGENVPGLLSSRGGADFETIVGSLTECGYGVAWAVLDAQYFGVAQRRRRVFIVGHSGGQPRPEVLALSEGLFGHPEPRRETGERTAPTLAARTRGGTDDLLNGALAPVAIQDTTRMSKDQNGAGVSDEDVSYTLDGQSRPGVAFMENQRGETWEAPIAQAVNSGGGKPGQGYAAARIGAQVRRLTPLEGERLQGFPDGWTDTPGNSDTQRYRQLGNAVAVPVVEWLLRRLV